MFTSRRTQAILAASSVLALLAGGAQAVTISGWDLTNVGEPTELNEDGTGFSYVYDRDVSGGTEGAISSGRIAFTPPEAVAPGIKVDETDDDKRGVLTEGCLMTSNPPNTCDGPFQSGKRIKQQMTGFGPVDLVFNLDFDNSTLPEGDELNDPVVYQVFHRLINVTDSMLDGFKIQLGFGVGDDFKVAGEADGVFFSQDFEAQPDGSGPASTQFPFGLFGDADTNKNFTLDGFFEPERAKYAVELDDDVVATELKSTGLVGPYEALFGNWLPQQGVPEGALWEYEVGKDPLVMAWDTGEGWEVRRGINDSLDGVEGTISYDDVFSLEESAWETFAYDQWGEMVAFLSDVPLFADVIEDLANLNVNFGIQLDHELLAQGLGGKYGSFTMRTIVSPVPLPAGAPLLLGGLGALAMVRRRRRRAA